MKTRVYLKDWFYNAGIVGFLRILEHEKQDFVDIKENYIEFDIKNLKNFHQYYFNYFFDTYNVAKRTNMRIEESFEKIESYLKKEPLDKQEEKQTQENLKNEKKKIKEIIKKQLDKIKKIEEETYQEILKAYNEIDTIKAKEDINKAEEIKNIIIQELEKDKINKRLTMNFFKSILSKNYFGQPSFLNVVKTALSFEEQEEVMYTDYISNLIETDFLQGILEGKYNIEGVKKYIKEKHNDSLRNKDMMKIYANIMKKYIEKGKNIEEIQKYIEENVLSNCYMCENENALTSNYSESNFVPLAISSDNMKNFFWNQRADFPICDLCKLILFCIPAGITSITKTVKENIQGQVVYKEKELLSFVNYDTSVNKLLKVNNTFSIHSKRDKNMNNPYAQLILEIVEQDKQISQWQLENIFVVEFETEYLAYSRMEYFNIKRYIAKFFQSYADKTLNSINDYRFKLQLVDYILKNKDILKIVNDRLREDLSKENKHGYTYYLATKIRVTLEILKKEGLEVSETIEKANKKSHLMFTLGNEIYEKLKKENNENKLDSYIYKMLNCIKGNRKDEFMDTAIRVIWAVGRDVPEILVKNNEEIQWQDLGHSFIAGLTQERYRKNEEVKENE